MERKSRKWGVIEPEDIIFRLWELCRYLPFGRNTLVWYLACRKKQSPFRVQDLHWNSWGFWSQAHPNCSGRCAWFWRVWFHGKLWWLLKYKLYEVEATPIQRLRVGVLAQRECVIFSSNEWVAIIILLYRWRYHCYQHCFNRYRSFLGDWEYSYLLSKLFAFP